MSGLEEVTAKIKEKAVVMVDAVVNHKKYKTEYVRLSDVLGVLGEWQKQLRKVKNDAIKGKVFSEPQVYVVHYADNREPSVYIKIDDVFGVKEKELGLK